MDECMYFSTSIYQCIELEKGRQMNFKFELFQSVMYYGVDTKPVKSPYVFD